MNRGLKITFGAVGVLIVGAGLWRWMARDRSDVTYREHQVQRGDLAITVLATGTVQPENRLQIKPPIAGRVESVQVVEGQVVKKGQILAWMSSTERAALLDAARSKGLDELKRWEELYRPTPILAPINGTIISRAVEAGQTFATTDAILVMSDRLTVKAQIDETDMAQVKLKQRAEITLDAYPAVKIPAVVDQIAFEAKTVNNVTTYVADVLPDKVVEFMRSGMTANVTFFVESKNGVLLIPNDALSASDGQSLVKIREAGGKVVDREIHTGLSDGKRTEVLDGLGEGDVVLSVIVKAKSREQTGSSPFGLPRPPKGARGGNR